MSSDRHTSTPEEALLFVDTYVTADSTSTHDRILWVLAEEVRRQHALLLTMQDRPGLSDMLERAYWEFDARRKGYGVWSTRPMSERDSFKAAMVQVANWVADSRSPAK